MKLWDIYPTFHSFTHAHFQSGIRHKFRETAFVSSHFMEQLHLNSLCVSLSRFESSKTCFPTVHQTRCFLFTVKKCTAPVQCYHWTSFPAQPRSHVTWEQMDCHSSRRSSPQHNHWLDCFLGDFTLNNYAAHLKFMCYGMPNYSLIF